MGARVHNCRVAVFVVRHRWRREWLGHAWRTEDATHGSIVPEYAGAAARRSASIAAISA
jgi:hypothetical protein